MGNKKKTAVVLLSGGIDSATCAAIAKSEGFELSVLTFSYGQKHSIELKSAKKICDFFEVKNHFTISIPSEIFASSALSGLSGTAVPKDRELSAMKDIPVTYVPGRNILFLSYAISYAESIGSRDIFIGANAVDYSGYPDCRPEFIVAFENMANTGTKAGITGDPFKIHAPLISMKKSEIIKTGTKLGIDYSLTHSCYDPDENGASCGKCDSCLLRKAGFIEAEIPDPTKYK